MKLIESENIVSLKKNGFTNVKNFFEEEEILNLSKEIDRIYPNEIINSKQSEDSKKEEKTESDLNQDKFNYLINGSDNNGTFGAPILGCSELIDSFMQKLFNNLNFQKVCEIDSFLYFRQKLQKLQNIYLSLQSLKTGYKKAHVTSRRFLSTIFSNSTKRYFKNRQFNLFC